MFFGWTSNLEVEAPDMKNSNDYKWSSTFRNVAFWKFGGEGVDSDRLGGTGQGRLYKN